MNLSAIRKELCISIAGTRVTYPFMWGGGVKMEMETVVYIREIKQRSLFLQSRYTLREDTE